MATFRAPFSSFPVGAIIRQGQRVFKKVSACEYGKFSPETGKIGREQLAEPWDQFMAVDQEWLNKRKEQKDRQKANRRGMDEAMRSVGMKKVKGNLGGTYWE